MARKYYTSTMFCGEIILCLDRAYNSYEEAKANTDDIYNDVDWEEFDKDWHFIGSSYQDNLFNPYEGE